MNKLHIDKITMAKIRKVKDFQDKTILEIARESGLTMEAVGITLDRYNTL